MDNDDGTVQPRPKRKPIENRTGMAWTYADEKRKLEAEDAEWASKCGPVTVRYINKEDDDA